uniref:CapA family protein n=1 Tax=Faecousia sp. TaxID=2952921 RepID=UPI0040286FCD
MSRQQRSPIIQILLVLIAVLFVADVIVIGLCLKTPGGTKSNQKPSASQGNSNTPSPTDGTELPTEEAPQLVSTATVLSTGDILMHGKVINSGKQDDGSYNFDSIFQYVKSYAQAADFSVANLETTLCGTDNGYAYAGNPKFNCPDAIVDSLKGAGFDMLLTANNHADDTSLVGYKRTLNVVRGKGLDTLGTYLSADEQKWTIEEVNGIKIGMVCYTYSDGFSQNGYPLLNYNEVGENGILNYFTYDKLPEFYTQLQGYLDEMKAAGAEATVVYLHWGEEYKWKTGEGPNANQTAMAQKLCDMGVDVIVGGHPHVVQPVDLLTSGTDAEHKTIVLYSMGNAVSNQRKEEMQQSEPTGHTEDGVLFCVTFAKYSDGSVFVDSAELIPTWVNMHANSGSTEYNILPLEEATAAQWQAQFGLTDTQLANAKASFDRTQALTLTGMEKVQSYLAQQKQPQENLPLDNAA